MKHIHQISYYEGTRSERLTRLITSGFIPEIGSFFYETDWRLLWFYDGTEWIPTTSPRFTAADFVDEFVWNSLVNGSIGELGWYYTAVGTPAVSVGTPAGYHYGIVRLGTGALINNNTRLHPGVFAYTNQIYFNSIVYADFIIRIPTAITTMIARIGFGQDVSNSVFGNYSAYFEYDSSLSANWKAYNRATPNTTGPTDTGVVVTVNNWYVLRIRRNPINGYIEFYINEALVATHSTNLPSGNALSPGFYVETLAASARNLDVDYYRHREEILNNRWT